jgi:hypothetical protein
MYHANPHVSTKRNIRDNIYNRLEQVLDANPAPGCEALIWRHYIEGNDMQ